MTLRVGSERKPFPLSIEEEISRYARHDKLVVFCHLRLVGKGSFPPSHRFVTPRSDSDEGPPPFPPPTPPKNKNGGDSSSQSALVRITTN
jgi:hypothetical protein